MKPYAPLLLLTFCLIGCATPDTAVPLGTSDEIKAELTTQKTMVIQQITKEELRIHTLAYPLLKANTALCEKNTYVAGVGFWSLYDIPYEERDYAKRALGLTEAVQVQFVVPKAPGARAGLKAGDIITHINTVAIGEGRYATQKLIDAIRKDQDKSLRLTYQHAGKSYTAQIARDTACDVALHYDSQDHAINAYVNKTGMHFTRGMLRFATTDNELSLVISHELAHMAMKHLDKSEQNAVLGSLAGLTLDVLAAAGGINTNGAFNKTAGDMGGQSHSIAFEQEADYVGLYMMARAGQNTSQAANFWRRMTSENSAGDLYAGKSHPTSPERFIALDKTHREIQKKRSSGQSLMPNIRSGN